MTDCSPLAIVNVPNEVFEEKSLVVDEYNVMLFTALAVTASIVIVTLLIASVQAKSVVTDATDAAFLLPHFT